MSLPDISVEPKATHEFAIIFFLSSAFAGPLMASCYLQDVCNMAAHRTEEYTLCSAKWDLIGLGLYDWWLEKCISFHIRWHVFHGLVHL